MARVAIAYAVTPDQPDRRAPLAVLAQDDHAVALVAVPQDEEALAKNLGLPSQTFVCWASSRQATLEPLRQRVPGQSEFDLVPVTDPRWLAAYTQVGYVDTYAFGPITETPGAADDVAKRLAAELAPQA